MRRNSCLQYGFLINSFTYSCAASSCWGGGLAPAAMIRGYSLWQSTDSHCRGFPCCGAQTLTAVVSLVAEHRLSLPWFPLGSAGSWLSGFGSCRLSCSAACGVSPDQEANLGPPTLAGWSLIHLSTQEVLSMILIYHKI